MGNDLSSGAGAALPTPPTATQTTKAVSGSHQLHIAGYSRVRGLGVGKCISSASFFVGGCSWTIHFYPNGTNEADKHHISLGLTLCGGPRKAHALVDFALLDWHEIPWRDAGSKHSSYDFWRGDARTVKFMEREAFEASDYLTNDAFIIQCTVTVMELPPVKVNHEIVQSMSVPPCKFRQQLGHLFASSLGADVTFGVGAETFHAHRCVLAASSPVFRAHLFGPMKERNMNYIRIEEIEPAVFREMLNFIYTDTIADEPAAVGKGEPEPESFWMHQHLLVAADRFGLERLRSTCEFLLCRDLNGDNMSGALVLAVQHNCGQLKAACLRYMASTEKVLRAVMATEGFGEVERSCPRLAERMKACCREKERRNGRLIMRNALVLFACVLWIVICYFAFT